MIPFARVLTYGNRIDNSLELKIYSNSTSAFVLDLKTSNLYASTYVVNGAGTGKIEPKFVLSATDVKKLWLEDNSSQIAILEKNDGSFWAVGSSYAITGIPANFYTVWTNISSLFSAVGLNGDNIAYMSSYYNLKINVVSTDGSLYCCGKNSTEVLSSFGDGTNTDYFNALRKINAISGVKKAVGNYYLKTDGSVYATGINVNYQYGNGTTTGVPTLVQVQNNIQDINAGYQNLYTLDNNGVLRGNGRQFGAQYGNEFGTGGSSSTGAVVYPTPVQMASSVEKLYVCVGNMATHIMRGGNSLYSTGSNALGQLGLGNLLPTYSYTRSFDFNSEAQFVRVNLGSLLFYGNKLYYSGRDDIAMGGTGTEFITTFTEVPLTFLL